MTATHTAATAEELAAAAVRNSGTNRAFHYTDQLRALLAETHSIHERHHEYRRIMRNAYNADYERMGLAGIYKSAM